MVVLLAWTFLGFGFVWCMEGSLAWSWDWGACTAMIWDRDSSLVEITEASAITPLTLLLLTVNVVSLASDSLLVSEKDESDSRNEPVRKQTIEVRVVSFFLWKLTNRTNRSSSFTVSRGGQKHWKDHGQASSHVLVGSTSQGRREPFGVHSRNWRTFGQQHLNYVDHAQWSGQV